MTQARHNGFTLLELLVVIAIMGLLGTISIGGYRAATRGMERSGVRDSASTFLHAAQQRALMDRQPTAVLYWNETLAKKTDDADAVIQGRAVAVRRAGRVTAMTNKNGDILFDEFADLNLTYRNDRTDPNVGGAIMRLYRMMGTGDLTWSEVSDVVHCNPHNGGLEEVFCLDIDAEGQEKDRESANGGSLSAPDDKPCLEMSGFVIDKQDTAKWSIGDAYGIEFGELTLPKGFIFGNAQKNDNVVGPGEPMTLFFAVNDTSSKSLPIQQWQNSDWQNAGNAVSSEDKQ